MVESEKTLRVTIAGSYRKHFDRIVEAKRAFEALGAVVLRPAAEQIAEDEGELVRLEGDPDRLRAIKERQLEAIVDGDLLYVVNPGGYMGPSTTFEAGWAHRGGIPLVSSEPSFNADVAIYVSAVGTAEQAVEWIGRNNEQR